MNHLVVGKMVGGPPLQERGSHSPSAPPSYDEVMGGVPPVSPFTPQQPSMVQTNIVTTVVPVGKQSTHMVCPKCHAEINTLTRLETPKSAYVTSLLICFFGGCLGCCLIPFCMKSFKDVHHSCPNCQAYLGAFPATARKRRHHRRRRHCRR